MTPLTIFGLRYISSHLYCPCWLVNRSNSFLTPECDALEMRPRRRMLLLQDVSNAMNDDIIQVVVNTASMRKLLVSLVELPSSETKLNEHLV